MSVNRLRNRLTQRDNQIDVVTLESIDMTRSHKKRSTIRDVAKLSGVSSATVSHVLNGTRFVSDEIRERVLAAVTTLHYTPSALARSLSTRVTHSIGVVVSDISNPFFTAVVRTIGDYALPQGYYLTVCNTDADVEQEQNVIQALVAKQVDGLIIAPIDSDAEHFTSIRKQGVPLVFIDRGLTPSVASTVCVDNRLGAQRAIEHFIADGHHSIAIILGMQSLQTSQERLQGYYDALEAHGIAVDERWIHWSNSRIAGGFEMMQQLLAETAIPSAIFVGNNQMTIGSLHALREAGMRVPTDLALIGFDDHDWASIFTPPLTVVRQPTREIGRLAFEALFRLMNNPENPPETARLLPELIVRGSCSEGCLNAYESNHASRQFKTRS